jgi:hypothetical protein
MVQNYLRQYRNIFVPVIRQGMHVINSASKLSLGQNNSLRPQIHDVHIIRAVC